MLLSKQGLWLGLLLLTGCSTIQVTTDHDATVNFAGYRSYFWKQAPSTGNPLMDGRIVSAVDGQLASRGWLLTSEAKAQTALAGEVITRENQRMQTIHHGRGGPGWGGGWGMGGMGGMGGPMMSTSHVINYTIGTFVLDIYDAQTRNVIWRGTVSDTVSTNPAAVRKTIDEGARKLFAGFPPGSVGK
jgi:hypothetical protein